ncbi:hypothetical protein BBJ28_00004645 [Nothophytophthora sp. Chile5]|nr:hypothetical protein BBJ28_00004645 [Nothophytophthora sp. Chile5]
METDTAEADPLLLSVAEGEELPLSRPQPRRRRLHRLDVACLAVVSFVACFVGVYPPAMRSENPLWHPMSVPKADEAFQYMTYDDIDEVKRREGYAVTYTERGFAIDDKHSLLLGGSVHYPRSTPAMWKDLLLKAKHDGLNHIELCTISVLRQYVFWNLHEQQRGVFDFAGSANITRFYETAAQMGLFLHVRFGPYACAEWSNGGLPIWLNWMPDMHVRSSNEPWQKEMERFVRYMVELSRPFLASNGGPIIMAQIENEFNYDDREYVQWCGDLVQRLNTSIPWVMYVMAKTERAANNTILTCNGNDCVEFAQKQVQDRSSEPLIWTEDEGWFETWSERPNHLPDDQRTPEDVAYAVARWFAVGGAAHNYYVGIRFDRLMYHGGNNYGRAASAGVTTMYADGVNLHTDGLSNEPKRSHLRNLHQALIECNEILLSNDRQLLHPHELPVLDGQAGSLLSSQQRAFIYGPQTGPNQVTFLENQANQGVTVTFGDVSYDLARNSILILKDATLLFNSSDVHKSFPVRQHRSYTPIVPASALQWETWNEFDAPPLTPRKRVVAEKPVEQLRLTADRSDYLIYETLFGLDDPVAGKADNSPNASTLTLTSCEANGFLAFVDGRFIGEKHLAYPGDNCSKEFEFDLPLDLEADHQHDLKLVSVSLGVHSLGLAHMKGLTGGVHINQEDLTTARQWQMYPGLLGEELEIYRTQWTASVPWVAAPQTVVDSKSGGTSWPMAWHKTSFRYAPPSQDEPTTADPVEQQSSTLLDCMGLTRGRAYINGHDLGRYWLIKNGQDQFVQRYYHIPPDWLLKDQENLLVVFDELGGSVANVSLVSSTVVPDAATVSSSEPPSSGNLPVVDDTGSAILAIGRV